MKLKFCLTQDGTVFVDKVKTLDKVELLICRYAEEGFELIGVNIHQDEMNINKLK